MSSIKNPLYTHLLAKEASTVTGGVCKAGFTVHFFGSADCTGNLVFMQAGYRRRADMVRFHGGRSGLPVLGGVPTSKKKGTPVKAPWHKGCSHFLGASGAMGAVCSYIYPALAYQKGRTSAFLPLYSS